MVETKDLPADVLFIVFQLLSSKPDLSVLTIAATSRTWQQARCTQASLLLNANLVNRNWHSVAQPLIDKTLDLTLSERNELRNLHVLGRLRQGGEFGHRVQHIRIRDVHTRLRRAVGVADNCWDIEGSDLEPEHMRPSGMPGYFHRGYELEALPEASLQRQIRELNTTLWASAIQSFEWAAVPPIDLCLVDVLTEKDIDVHIKLNPHAVETAAWSQTPLVNYAILGRLRPFASRLRSLHLCLRPYGYYAQADAQDPMAPAVSDFLRHCPRLEDFQLHALGRPATPYRGEYDDDDDDDLNDLYRRNYDALKGPLGPVRALAEQAHVTNYLDWQTGEQYPEPYTSFRDLCVAPNPVLWLSGTLTILTLRNFCLCKDSYQDLRPLASEQVFQLPALRELSISCLRTFAIMGQSLKNLQMLCIFLGDDWRQRFPGTHAGLPFLSAHCEKQWRQDEVTEALVSLHGLSDLRLYGHPNALSQLALLHHGKTLRKLVILHREQYDRTIAYGEAFKKWPLRMRHLPEYLTVLGNACPILEDFSCDAPNASTAFDSFLEILQQQLTSLRSLHIRRSLEPYGDTIPATKLSYARFTRSAVALVWSKLSTISSLDELKITIGRMSAWSDEEKSLYIAPHMDSRTFVLHRALIRSGPGRTIADEDIMFLEEKEARLALSQGRPAPLIGYWQRQAELAAQFAEERNVPVFPERQLVGGTEKSRPRAPTPARCGAYLVSRRYDSSVTASEYERRCLEWEREERLERENLELSKRAFDEGVKAQHDLEVLEAAEPTRQYY